ncbi:unnamed protein product [Peronospora belbahrii]|uniref:Uncharacterized protein n=1 Tax=Peronospora belbahrii TaxID=622444 RepID=A0ABN8CXE0_9STRA|nr:unnamed protein product [Peronospora belbahrii]
MAMAVVPSCAEILRLTTTAFEKEIASRNATEAKKLFGAQNLADADFFYMIADAAAMAVQYGHKDVVCGSMITVVSTTLSVWHTITLDALMAMAKVLTARLGCPEGKKSPRDNVNLSAGVEKITKLYGGNHPPGHRIYFSNGGDDPWQRASVVATLSDDEIANVAKCNMCGHCGDLRASSIMPEPLKKQREEILEYLAKWLNTSGNVEVAVNAVHKAAAPLHVQVDNDNEQELEGLQLAVMDKLLPRVFVPMVPALLA